jgi:hypothetical protein
MTEEINAERDWIYGASSAHNAQDKEYKEREN